MLKYIFTFIISLLASLNLLATNIINIDNDAIRIEIRNIHVDDLLTLSQDSSGYFLHFVIASVDGIAPNIVTTINKSEIENIQTDIFNNFNKIEVSDNTNYSFDKYGTYRGIALYMLRVYPAFIANNKWQLITNEKISIRFSTPLTPNFDYNASDLSMLDDVINKEHIPYLKYLSDKKNNENTSAKRDGITSEWYNPETRYYEINTKTDGIASLPIAKLINLNPELLDKDPSFLHLYFLGKQEAFYLNDNNGKLDNSDTMYFVSKRAMGDTTWFDNFANQTTLYLSYDASQSSKQYSKSDLSSPIINDVKDVFSRVHIEKDSLYAEGIRLELSQTVSGEGWYHTSIDPLKDSILNLPIEMYPAPNSSILINSAFYARKVYPEGLFNNRLKASVNSLISDTTEYLYLPNDYNKTNTLEVNSENFYFGSNLLAYHSMGYPNNPTSNTLDELAYNYTEISGRCLPIARNGIADFYIDTLSDDSRLEIFPFKSSIIVALDTINNYNLLGIANKGFQLAVNTSNIAGVTKFNLNNESVITSDKIGFHLLQIDSKTLKTNYDYYASTDIERFIAKINSISDNTTIAIGINELNLTEEQLNLLQSIEIEIDNYNSSDCITAIQQRNDHTITKSNNFGIAKSIAFIKNDNANLYSYTLNLPLGKSYHIIASDDLHYEESIISTIDSSNLKNLQAQYNFVIITTKQFKSSAEKYLRYRELTHPDLKKVIVYTEDIYKEFNFGRKSPNAIKDYLKFAYNNWSESKLETMLIIGDACTDARKILPFTMMTDFVPGFGSPVSDTWYGFLDSEDDVLSDILLSRIPIKNETDMDNYLDKLKEYERGRNEPWKNSFLFLTGGNTTDERNRFLATFTDPHIDMYQASNICLTTEKISKSETEETKNADGIKIINSLNSGKIYTFFVGHGSPLVFDLDGWLPENLSNKGKYGIFQTISCNTAAFALPDANSRFENYLFTKDKGFIFCIGASATEIPEIGYIVASNATRAITDLKYRSPLKAFTYAKNYVYSTSGSSEYKPFLHTFLYHGNTLGCPLIKIPIDTIPELYLLTEEFSITGQYGNSVITDEENFANIKFTGRNMGTNEFNKVEVKIIDNYDNNSKSDTLYTEFNSICPSETINFQLPIKDKLGWHSLSIILDPNNLINEYKGNDTLVKQFQVLRKSLQVIEPMPYHNVYAQNPKFRFINPLAYDTTNSMTYVFELWRESKDNEPIITTSSNNITIDGTIIDWNPNTNLNPNENYILKAYFRNDKDNSESPYLSVPFYASYHDITDTVLFNIDKKQFSNLMQNNLEYYESDRKLSYKNDTVQITLIGINGYKRGDVTVNRGSAMTLDGEMVLSVYPTGYVGFNLVHYDSEFKNMRLRQYNTWGEQPDELAYLDSGSINFVRYLRDSVKTDDNIFIANMGESFRLFALHNKLHTEGSWDTLKTILESFGAKETLGLDTLFKQNKAWGISYAFATNVSKNNPQTYEAISLSGDSAVASGTMIKHYNTANLTINIDNIDKLKKLTLQSDNLLTKNSLTTKVIAWNADESVKHDLVDTTNCISLDFTNMDSKYQFYQVTYQFAKTAPEPNELSISAIKSEFLPNAELGIFKTKEMNQELLNGDEDALSFRLRNLSLRRAIDSLKMQTVVTNQATEIDKYDSTIYNILPNTDISIGSNLITDNYPLAIALQTEATNLNGYDLFNFNNTLLHSQIFLKDTEKPEIVLEVDDHIVHDGEYIQIRPKFRAYIKDNSPRVITGESNLKVKINSFTVTNLNSPDYQFISNPKGSEIKAELIFKPDTLVEFDENIIRVYVEDANQNRDTAYYRLFVNRRGEIKQLSIYPNPLQVNSTIEFDYAAPKIGGYSKIEIYDYTGQIVNSYTMSLNIGKNQIPIIVTDQNNAQLASGVYFYRISIQNTEIYVEPITDKFIIVR